MGPERWQKIEQLYHSALEIETCQRGAYLAIACGGDEELREEVESLLVRAERGTNFLETPAMALAAKAIVGAGGDRVIPAAIGRYRVVRLVGEGGMGVVYEAEQDQPRRVVALKVIKPGLATAETLWRFQDESQALGRLQHPGIAQVYEAGTAETGFGPQPYFAMELIRGLPLHEYAVAHKLTALDRLALMAKICDAAEHAHQHRVIHRDLKPGNILVDETGQPKILDFGVARLTESDAQYTRQTELGQLVGTLAYMSPEQVAGDPLALDARSDIYALGVILYELLSEKLPYDISRKPLPEAIEVIRQEEPAPLSSINRSYRGDIETIAAKALEKDKGRRYGSAAELAADIRRYLADEPVTARPASATYQLQKFARRHKALVAGTAVVFAVLTVGVVAASLEAIRARRAEQVAEAVNSFLQNDLLAQASANGQAGAGQRPDPDLTVRTALDRAAARIAGKFKQPEVEAAIRDTIGATYVELGAPAEASQQLERVLQLRREIFGPDAPETLRTMNRLAEAYFDLGHPSARSLWERTLGAERRVLGLNNPETLKTMSDLSTAYERAGNYAQAETLQSEALAAGRRTLGPEHPITVRAMDRLAITYMHLGRNTQAERLAAETLAIRQRVLGPEHPLTLRAMSRLANSYAMQGKYEPAEAKQGQLLEMQRRLLGPEHPDTQRTLYNLGDIYLARGKYVLAEKTFREGIQLCCRDDNGADDGSLMLRSDLALAYLGQGRYRLAEALLRHVLEVTRGARPPEHPTTLRTLASLTDIYQREGKYAVAETYSRRALAGWRHTLGPEHPDTMESAADLALVLQSRGRFTESEPLAREALGFFEKKQPDDWHRFRAESLLGASLAGQRKYAQAEPLLLEGYRGMLARKDKIAVPDKYHLDRAREWLVQLYEAWGKPEKAEEWRQNGLTRVGGSGWTCESFAAFFFKSNTHYREVAVVDGSTT